MSRDVESATDRLARLLTLVPWLLNRQGVDIDAAATEFGVTTEQMEADLALLFLCGTPGGMPDDLIEAEWEDGRVYLGNADTIARPLRLGLDEALTLIVGLRTLAALPGLGDTDAVERALAKVEAATAAFTEADRIHIDIRGDLADDDERVATVRDALARHRRLRLGYFVPSRDETTERDVDPMRVTTIDGHWYLEGWCHRALDVRLFRLDRIRSLAVLDVDGTPPERARPRDLDAGAFQARDDDARITVDLDPEAHWIVDYYPVESVRELRHGEHLLLRAVLRTADLRWLTRLVLQMGGTARVVDPPEVAAQVREAARTAASLYDRTRLANDRTDRS